MDGIEDLVPGYEQALERDYAAWRANRGLCLVADLADLPRRDRALVAVAVAGRMDCEYCAWAASRLAERAGIGASDAFLASIGVALDPRDAALLRAAGRAFEQGMRVGASWNATEISALVAYWALAFSIVRGLAPRAAMIEWPPVQSGEGKRR